MAGNMDFELLGLEPTASREEIKCAYRTLAKKFHPDKNESPDATLIFQKLNKAYQTLISHVRENDSPGDCDQSDTVNHVALSYVSISTRENTFSVTIDITDVMFLAFIEVCEHHHDVKPIDRGQHGIQYRFSYTSPSDTDYYGTLSLTFFSTTSRLLVQGSSYLLWVEEHLPLIQQQAHARCIEDMGTWRATARRRGIGIRRNARASRRTRQQHAAIDEANQDNDVPTQEEPGDHNEVACPDSYTEVAAVPQLEVQASPPDQQHPPYDTEPGGVVANEGPELSSRETVADEVPPSKLPLSVEAGISKTKKVKRVKKKAHAKTDNPVPVCYPNCASSKSKSNMIRCTLCMRWVHISCSDVDSKYVGAWTCVKCRALPSAIDKIETQLSNLSSFVHEICEKEAALKEEIKQLERENGNLKQKIGSLENVNHDLTKLIETMSERASDTPGPTDGMTSATSVSVPTVSTANRFTALATPPTNNPASSIKRQQPRRGRPATKPSTVTIVGSSLVRGVAPLVNDKELDATGFVNPGRTARQINARVRNIPTTDITVMAAGTINIQRQPLELCKEELRQLIDNVSRKRKNKTVIMSQIPKRYDEPTLNKKIDLVNEFISSQISHHKNWHLLTHRFIPSDYKKDGLHLNDVGVAKYAKKIKQKIRSIKLR